MRPETEPWWRQAQADMEAARHNYNGGQSYVVSWFVQQAVEKGLKAVFLEKRRAVPPRTHDLEALGVQVGATEHIQADLVFLNPTFDLARYPDDTTGEIPVDAVTPELAARHLAAAERVMIWLEAQLR